MVEEVGDLNYRLTLPPYMKTHPVFYVGRLKRYIDPNEVKYPQSEETGDTMRRKAKDSLPTSGPYDDVVELENEGHHPSNPDPSPKLSHESPNDLSGVHNPDDPLNGLHGAPRSVARLDSRDRQSVVQQRLEPVYEQTKARQPRLGGRYRHSYRAPPTLVDAGENQRFLVGRLLAGVSDPRPIKRLPEEFQLLGAN